MDIYTFGACITVIILLGIWLRLKPDSPYFIINLPPDKTEDIEYEVIEEEVDEHHPEDDMTAVFYTFLSDHPIDDFEIEQSDPEEEDEEFITFDVFAHYVPWGENKEFGGREIIASFKYLNDAEDFVATLEQVIQLYQKPTV